MQTVNAFFSQLKVPSMTFVLITPSRVDRQTTLSVKVQLKKFQAVKKNVSMIKVTHLKKKKKLEN